MSLESICEHAVNFTRRINEFPTYFAGVDRRGRMRDKASKAETTQGEKTRGENNYDNGNQCETVYLDERKPAGNYERQVTIKQNNYCVEPLAWSG